MRILWELAFRAVLHDFLVALDDLTQRAFVQVRVELRAARFLDGIELVLERVLRDFEHDVPEHLDEAAVAVEREPSVLRPALQSLDRIVIQAEIQNRVHHAGHREFRARADRDEQRVLGRPERPVRHLLELLHVLGDFAFDGGRNFALLFVVDVADLGRDGEPRRHGQSGVGHLGEARALAAEQILHRAVAVSLAGAEKIHVLAGFPGRFGLLLPNYLLGHSALRPTNRRKTRSRSS